MHISITDFVLYGSECTFEAAQDLEKLPAVREADMIFAVGGGKAVDTAREMLQLAFSRIIFMG